uniref:Uncharacterized protein n=1 Tax=Cacopsylla melanoneura TaxID=428564 RepID=A0A8D8PMK9_9HEMI
MPGHSYVLNVFFSVHNKSSHRVQYLDRCFQKKKGNVTRYLDTLTNKLASLLTIRISFIFLFSFFFSRNLLKKLSSTQLYTLFSNKIRLVMLLFYLVFFFFNDTGEGREGREGREGGGRGEKEKR